LTPYGFTTIHSGWFSKGFDKFMSEQQREVYRQFRNAQDKYTYFLLAATGAAVALAVRETENAALM